MLADLRGLIRRDDLKGGRQIETETYAESESSRSENHRGHEVKAAVMCCLRSGVSTVRDPLT